jgi:hypothetical protein
MAFQQTRKTFYGTETFHEDPDSLGDYVIQKTFDREPVIESCTQIRNEVDQRARPLRLAMRIPPTLFWQWLKDGTLRDDDYTTVNGGGIAIKPEKLAQCMREYSKLACMDKL